MQPMKVEKGNVARFTREEKTILFSLFQEYEEVIDIKHRKNSTPKKTCDVRRCWQIILDTYNNDPQVKTLRSLKQLQKFWLNSRLRKRYPSVVIKDESIVTASPPSPIQLNGPPPLKSRPFPEQKIKTMAATKENFKYDFQIITHQEDDDDDKSKAKAHQQVSIDTISTENLSLNDLLEFKNSSHAEIIELKPLHINRNRTNGSALENVQNDGVMYEEADDCEEEPDRETITVIEGIAADASSFNHKQQVSNCCCAHRNYSDHHSDYSAPIDDRLNMYRIKEAEFKYKEQQLRYVREKMELTKTREELRHARELHRLQIQEMKTKLSILAEEEKKLMSSK